MRINFKNHFLVFLLMPLISGCGFFAGTFVGGTGKLNAYSFEKHTKKEFYQAIQCMYKSYPQFYPPSTINPHSLIHHYQDLSSPESKRINADSVQFHFYLKTSTNELLYWTSFIGLEENWKVTKYEYGVACELALIGFKLDNSGWKTFENFKNKKRIKNDPCIKLFESEILSKIIYFLEHPSDCH